MSGFPGVPEFLARYGPIILLYKHSMIVLLGQYAKKHLLIQRIVKSIMTVA